jgi:RNA polymerase sigma-70 factor (ECF subfamily)
MEKIAIELNDARARELLKEVANGNETAMHELFSGFSHVVYAFALNRLNDNADASDVVNDVMLQVWKHAGRFESRSKVKTWLLGIANHKVIDIFRKRGKVQFEEVDEKMADESSDCGALEISQLQDAQSIQRCMEKLSDNHRQVVHLAFYEDLPYPEIADILNCPTGTVKTRMMHAKNNLKRCLEALMFV